MTRVRGWIKAVLTHPISIWSVIVFIGLIEFAFIFANYEAELKILYDMLFRMFGFWAIVVYGFHVGIFVMIHWVIGNSLMLRYHPELEGSAGRPTKDDRLGTDEYRIK
jgi:hypothetical protein